MGCVKVKQKKYVICSGNLNNRIIVYDRNILQTSNTHYTEEFGNGLSTNAMIETLRGITKFDNTNTERVVTHRFTVRFRGDISNSTSEKFLEFNNRYFKCVTVENKDEANEFLVFDCYERGSKLNKVNWA